MRVSLLVLSMLVLAATALSAEESVAPVDFVRDVQPIFAKHCIDCHGQSSREGGLRLDRQRAALAGGDSGTVIVPGKPDESLLIKYVSGEGETVMPPETEGLAEDEIAVLRRWISEGVAWPATADAHDPAADHWAYQPLVRHEPPTIDGATLPPIDAFVRAKLRVEGIEPSPEADRVTLIKRLYYDLLGLPPEPEAVDAFFQNPSPLAYEELVDDLLASPHYGERWGRHWLDVARYADSDGYEKDNPRYNAWKYRDWVIQAVNDDLPFDQFTIQQLAGDLLPDHTTSQLVATGFNRQTLTNTGGGTDPEQWRVEAVFDRVETLGTAWLGLTVGCARCHTHKYDAISQREYYQLFAFFNNGDETTTNVATTDRAMDEYKVAQATYEAQLAEKRRPLDERRAALAPGLAAWEQDLQAKLAGKLDQPSKLETVELGTPTSTGGATFDREPDGSLLVTGERPATDTYEVQCTISATGITALQIDTLSHDSLQRSGPGRADNGNFVLSELEARLHTELREVPLTFSSARADVTQKDFDAAQVIDGKLDDGGWAAGQNAKNHWVLAYLSDESRSALAGQARPAKITVRLTQQYSKSPHHTIGRFNLRAMTGYDEQLLGLPETVRQVLVVKPESRDQKQNDLLLEHFAGLDSMYRELRTAVDEFQKQAPFKPEMTVAVLQERTNERRVTKMLRRGDFLSPMSEVSTGVLEVLPPLQPRTADAAADRLDLAQWLVAENNPLPARVAVNHIWSHLFGRGLVKTIADFGVRGEAATHPELLDWLATEYRRLGWSRKALIKTIVTSHTYKQSSRHRPELADKDPENRWLYRQNRLRVEAEIVRDLHLAASGLLSRQVGGPSVFPPLPPGIQELSYANNFKWGKSDWNTRSDRPTPLAPEQDVHRRGMYTFFKRTAPHPSLTTFDCPDANLTNVQRSLSNTPLQALLTLNNTVFLESARGLTHRTLTDVNTNDGERVARMFRLCVARTPSDTETNAFLDLLTTSRDYYRAHEEQAVAFAGDKLPPETTSTDAAAWTATARMMLNLDEFITRE
jgi:mono/diheme cytochrome c family protein